MACQVEQIADCGDLSSLARALFIPDKEDFSWLSQCSVSLSSCGGLLAVGYRSRLCLLASQWISSSDSNTYLISWSGTLPSDVTALASLPICPTHQSSQNGPDWFCIIVGFKNGTVGFYTSTGHLLLSEKLDERPVLKISCHTGTYGTLPDDIHVLFQNCECIIPGSNLFQMLRFTKTQLARVQAGVQSECSVDGRSLQIRKWCFAEQDVINDAEVVGLELKNTYDHLLAASTYGGYDTWYRSIPPANTLVLGAGARPYVGFHYALEGGAAPPLHDVARAVANKIKSALPGWLGGGSEAPPPAAEQKLRAEPLSMRSGLCDAARHGITVAVSPDRRLAAVADSLGRVAVLDVARGNLVRLFKGYRDAQCSFIQVFEQDVKKPQLSTIKETRRAIFLIIYNPKKGLIDIRLMQRGNRVAVFTATKNGRLLYNTCGLVGAEQNYTHKKLNLPEFQCVLIDPDGKLKRFNVPFFFALDGEHSERSKDLHILRDMRESLKSKAHGSEFDRQEIIKKASELKTLDLKKHCLEMLIRNYGVPADITAACLEIFWDSMSGSATKNEAVKVYFRNLALVTLFYRRINNENTGDMEELIKKVRGDQPDEELQKEEELRDSKIGEDDDDFHLLEDDSCVLERLLIMAQEKDHKQNQHARVTFADNVGSMYKEFVSCFQLEDRTEFVALKANASVEKLGILAAYTFKSIFKVEDLSNLTNFVRDSRIDPKEIVKLVIVHLTNMSLNEISVELIEKIVAVIYYLSKPSKEASRVAYNEESPWWRDVRAGLAAAPCPLRGMLVAMACKAAGRLLESQAEDEAWESVTKENALWGLLIGQLEDISILSIVLRLREKYKGKCLPKLYAVDADVNLQLIHSRGKGSVTELIAKWLCSLGALPEAVMANELLARAQAADPAAEHLAEPDCETSLFLEHNRVHVDENPAIFKWLSLLRQQFPCSTAADYIVANMCWEYALAWQKDIKEDDKLGAVLHCLKNIRDPHLQLGLCSIIWTTYVKEVFEKSCRLVNKVGKPPKERLCLQDVGLSDLDMLKFLQIATEYLENFFAWSTATCTQEKEKIQFEKIWQDSSVSLIEVAQDTKKVSGDILSLNYQIACTVYYMCHFGLKVTKPLNSLYDVDYHYIFEALTGKVEAREINMKPSEKLRNPRMKFVNKLVRAALELISCDDGAALRHCDTVEGAALRHYDTAECSQWIDKVDALAQLWGVDSDFVRRQQMIGLFHLGYDELAEQLCGSVVALDVALQPLLALTAQRLKRSLQRSAQPGEWLAAAPPHLVVHLNTLELDESVPAQGSLATTASMLQQLLRRLEPSPLGSQSVRLAELMLRGCQTLLELGLD